MVAAPELAQPAVTPLLSVSGLSARFGAVQALMRFGIALAHRMEEIGRIGKVLFINDSKATNADSTEKALLSFPRDVYWIAGGKPKAASACHR